VRIFNDRGSFTAAARVGTRAREGVVVAPSIWWQKLSPDGRNANAVTSQALTDVPLYAGFGISTPEQARAAADLTDGAVVGSQAVLIAEEGPAALHEYVASLRSALDA